jgi:hypothetical protein
MVKAMAMATGTKATVFNLGQVDKPVVDTWQRLKKTGCP